MLIATSNDGTFGDTHMLRENSFDLPEFDPMPANFHLVIETAEKLDIAVRQVAGKITRLVQPLTRIGLQRIVDELRRRQLALVQVPSRQSQPTNMQLTRDTNRSHLLPRVEDVHPHVAHRTANRDDARVASWLTSPRGSPYRRFCRAIHVVQVGLGAREKTVVEFET
jgi:hypothetical protein